MKLELKYTNWSQLPIGTYMKCKAIEKDDSLDEIEKNVKLLALFSDIDENDIWESSLDEINVLVNKLGSMELPKASKTVLKSINIDGVTYTVSQDLTKFTYAQFVDFQTYVKMGDDYTANMLACFIIPKGKKYNVDYDALEVAKIFNEKLSIVTANSCLVFFSQKLLSLTNKTWDSLEWTMKKMKKKEKDPKVKVKMEEAQDKMNKMRQLFGSIF